MNGVKNDATQLNEPVGYRRKTTMINDGDQEFKVALMGSHAVGKTSIATFLQQGHFVDGQLPTIGAEFFSKVIRTQNGDASLVIWDTAGQEKYRSLVPMYLRNAEAVIIVFDWSDSESFNTLKEWLLQVKNDGVPNCKVYLVGNKADLEPFTKRESMVTALEEFGLDYYFTSAKTGEGIEELFVKVATDLTIIDKRSVGEELIKNETPSSCC